MSNIKIWDNEPPMYNDKYDTEHNANCPYLEDYIIKDGNIHPIIVVCPGGGYDHRSDHEGANVAEWLNSENISAVVLNYRVFPYVHPVEINDAKRAIRYIRYNATKLGIDANKIGIMGFSAGAHLAVSTAEHFDKFDIEPQDDIDKVSAKPDIACLCYPVISLTADYSHERSGDCLLGEDKSMADMLSAEKSVREDMCPVFIWHTLQDIGVSCRNSVEMAMALREKGVDTELHLFESGKHGSDLAIGIEGTEQWRYLFINWLKRKNFCI